MPKAKPIFVVVGDTWAAGSYPEKLDVIGWMPTQGEAEKFARRKRSLVWWAVLKAELTPGNVVVRDITPVSVDGAMTVSRFAREIPRTFTLYHPGFVFRVDVEAAHDRLATDALSP